jgi:hypothetical protein
LEEFAMYDVCACIAYLFIIISVTIWVAWTLSRPANPASSDNQGGIGAATIGFVIRAVLGLLIGVICGASATTAVGSLIGLAYWVTGKWVTGKWVTGFAFDSWINWPLMGGMFGSVVGTLRCVIRTDALRGRPTAGSGRRAAVGAIAAAGLGALLLPSSRLAVAILFGVYGLIGYLIGALVGWRAAGIFLSWCDWQGAKY